MPDSVFKKFIVSIIIGLVCFMVGIVSLVLYRDNKMFFLSIVITAGMLTKGFLIYFQFKKGNFVTIKGKCTKVSGVLFAKYKTVYIETDEETLTLYLPKDVKILQDETYNFYFKKKPCEITPIYNKYITSKLNSDNFLGCEYIDDSEKSKRTDENSASSNNENT